MLVSKRTEFSFKVKSIPKTVYTISNKTKLVWKVTGNTITFGSSSQLRVVLGMGPIAIDARQAHHIIPWAKAISEHPIVQKAMKSGQAFHINDILNGIPLDKAIHNGNHSAYDSKILQRLEEFDRLNPNATLDQCFNTVNDIISDIRLAISNNPNTPINQLIF